MRSPDTSDSQFTRSTQAAPDEARSGETRRQAELRSMSRQERLREPVQVSGEDVPGPAVEPFTEASPATIYETPLPAQPQAKAGVTDDMATLVLNPSGLARPVRETNADSAFAKEQDGRQSLEAQVSTVDTIALHTSGDFGSLEDSAIMLELKAGNMAAFDHLMLKYRKPIINFMFRMTRNQAVAEELAQEVFLRVYRSRETYRAEARFSTWLYRIATNLGVNHARDTRHERSASTVYLDEPDQETGMSPDVPDSTPGVESRLVRDEKMAAIRDYVLALPERQRLGVLMHKYEGMDYKQIGEVLKLSESATKSLLFRAYQTLREKLKDFA